MDLTKNTTGAPAGNIYISDEKYVSQLSSERQQNYQMLKKYVRDLWEKGESVTNVVTLWQKRIAANGPLPKNMNYFAYVEFWYAQFEEKVMN